ncbi:Phosphatidylinositol:ceramide phosphoinositol transferase (IPC synthase) [Purpureocillium takamizusanense]|uniref:Phosphatidylinositol:ceramide phosphoinositol transferase (IPC synthase) n=1 Tax=Purpureocillium takamizusanense TaxID=2060973 RepID=A0A9Q8QDX6_9HYPO|nr:Phosphatidylinositol:ceramide phosphoinositol transferase (IPC synthase) [Purpureocillium takamizusanense]UNI17875.1 Phosphatidylinositol:ceramide phosphoinositol transferase (IPC synthase) [Purpureocillium takamizusanense]
MKDLPGSLPGKPVLPSLWTENLTLAVLNRLPNRYHVGRRRMRAKSNTARNGMPDITTLETSFSFWDGIRDLQKHKFKPTDLQYIFVAGLTLFMLWISPSAPTLKFFALVASVWVLLMPATRQFFLPSVTIWVWLLYFFCSRFIPYDYRPHIWVRVLPALENVLYGANLSNILSAHKHAVLDILAWLPYGIIHFGAPAVCSLLMFVFAAPGTLPVFARSFGWMSILGVTIQLVFPCTPPWYENEHGLVPAAYGMPGSPAGLARVDEIFGIDLYTTNFTAAPLPFGAFPSLHGGYAVLEALFMSHCFPQFRVFFIAYAGWIWWATMYLSHHYAIDLVGGGLIGMAFYYSARARWLPRRQADKMTRWDYDYVEVGDRHRASDEELGGQYFSLGLLEHRRASSSDGWTLGSSSSYSSSSGTVSPTISEGPPGMLLVDMESNGQLWDGNAAPRDVELSEVVVMR